MAPLAPFPLARQAPVSMITGMAEVEAMPLASLRVQSSVKSRSMQLLGVGLLLMLFVEAW